MEELALDRGEVYDTKLDHGEALMRGEMCLPYPLAT